MPPEAAIIGLIVLAFVFGSQPKKRWKCPAPGCDFSAEADREGAAKSHTLAHTAHRPVLKDE